MTISNSTFPNIINYWIIDEKDSSLCKIESRNGNIFMVTSDTDTAFICLYPSVSRNNNYYIDFPYCMHKARAHNYLNQYDIRMVINTQEELYSIDSANCKFMAHLNTDNKKHLFGFLKTLINNIDTLIYKDSNRITFKNNNK